MKKLLFGLAVSSFVGVASAMPVYHGVQPVPAHHVHVHYDHFDRNTYVLGGAIIGITAVMLVWAITDHYYDPTRFSVEF